MGFRAGVAAFAATVAYDIAQTRRERVANALVTPLIAIVYFYPHFSTSLLGLGLPWAITAPLFMLTLAIAVKRR